VALPWKSYFVIKKKKGYILFTFQKKNSYVVQAPHRFVSFSLAGKKYSELYSSNESKTKEDGHYSKE